MDAICFQKIQQTKQYNSTLLTIAIDQATSSEIWYYFSQFNPSTLLRSNATTATQHKLQIKPEASNDNRANKLQQPYMQILYGANYLLGLPNFWKWQSPDKDTQVKFLCAQVLNKGQFWGCTSCNSMHIYWGLWMMGNIVIVRNYALANSWILFWECRLFTSCWTICGHELPLRCDLSHTSWHWRLFLTLKLWQSQKLADSVDA